MHPVLIHEGNTYKTRSNRRVRVKTEDGLWINKKIGKKAKAHRCHGCNRKLTSIAAKRPAAFSRLKISERRVNRPYGFTHCGKCVANKVVETFLNEEEKLLKGAQ